MVELVNSDKLVARAQRQDLNELVVVLGCLDQILDPPIAERLQQRVRCLEHFGPVLNVALLERVFPLVQVVLDF